jgi:hypothetical protein
MSARGEILALVAGAVFGAAACSEAGDTPVSDEVAEDLVLASSLVACQEQQFSPLADAPSTFQPTRFNWQVKAPSGAVYNFAPGSPHAGSFTFGGQTVGDYTVSVTACEEPVHADGSNCANVDTAIHVDLGDSNGNGIGDQCEGSGACDCTGIDCGFRPGCNGACGMGACGDAAMCSNGACVSPCKPSCSSDQCGIDSVCLTSCPATCGAGQVCSDQGQCKACTPTCNGTCGSDGCGGTCTCSAGQICGSDHICRAACVPTCKAGPDACGADGCGGSCGTCPAGKICGADGRCAKPACVPACKAGPGACGDDGCGGTCGLCDDHSTCQAGRCAAQAAGRVVTIVMSLTDWRLAWSDPSAALRARLAKQAVEWVGRAAHPRVLVVHESQPSPLAAHEPQIIAAWLAQQQIPADALAEPAHGLAASQLASYDVVWLSSPHRPVRNVSSIAVLSDFVAHGKGLVLQGEDITQGVFMEPLTRLHSTGDGAFYCGQRMTGIGGATYEVRIGDGPQPVIAGLEHKTLNYAGDIDSSKLIAGGAATVLAWAHLPAWAGCGCKNKPLGPEPVVVAYERPLR